MTTDTQADGFAPCDACDGTGQDGSGRHPFGDCTYCHGTGERRMQDLDVRLGTHHFLCRVDAQRGSHTRFSVFAGSMDHSRGHTGQLAMRNEEWEDFRTALATHNTLIDSLQALIDWNENKFRSGKDDFTSLYAALEAADDALHAARGEGVA